MKRMGVLLSLGLMFICAFQGQARVFTVTDTADSTRISSLRGAIIAANRQGGRNIIVLQGAKFSAASPKVYHLTIQGTLEDQALTGDLDVTRGQLIIKASSANCVIDATALGDRVFEVMPGAQLSLIGLTITGGHAEETSFFVPTHGNGGAIFNAGSVTLQKCTLRNNQAGDPGYIEGNGGGLPGGAGGALYNSGDAQLIDCVIATNFCVSSGNGGGIQNDGTCALLRCSIVANQSGFATSGVLGNGFGGGNGGGIYNSQKMTLKDCVINGNASGDGNDGTGPSGTITINTPGGSGGPGGDGGGIYNEGQLQIDTSSIYQNQTGHGGNGADYHIPGTGGAGGFGGGIFNSGDLALNEVTISQNKCGAGGNGGQGSGTSGGVGAAGGGGGGLCDHAGTANLTLCTIALNQAGAGGNGGAGEGNISTPGVAGFGGDGGGVESDLPAIQSARGTLFALNTAGAGGFSGTNTYFMEGSSDPSYSAGSPAPDGSNPDIRGALFSEGFNLIGGRGPGLVIDIINLSLLDSDLIGYSFDPIDPLLGPLQMNGGRTPTHALLPGSPAIDQGNSFKIKKDQRGERRTVDDPAVSNGSYGDGTDIGAYEFSPSKERK